MNPAMQRQAMEMMSKMDPAQRAAMMQQSMNMMKNMSPEQMATMSGSMGLDPAQLAAAQAQMKNGAVSEEQLNAGMDRFAKDPNAATAAMNQMGKSAGATASYMLQGAETQKAEGNRLFKEKKYHEAIEVYSKVIENLSTTAQEAKGKELLKACRLNHAMCSLNTKAYPSCVETCTTVLADYPADLKALYRRGVAREALGELRLALEDLTAADATASGKDEGVRLALGRVTDAVSELPTDVPDLVDGDDCEDEDNGEAEGVGTGFEVPDDYDVTATTSDAEFPGTPRHADTGGGAEVDEDLFGTPRPKAATPRSVPRGKPAKAKATGGSKLNPSNPASAAVTKPATPKSTTDDAKASVAPAPGTKLSDLQREQMRRSMQSPEAAAEYQRQVRSMSAAQMVAQMRAQGVEMTEEQCRAAQAQVASMTPEQMMAQTKAAEKAMEANGGVMPTPAQQQAAMMKDPAAMKLAAEQMKNITPEQAARIKAETGMDVSPEQMKMAADMMSNMDPEQIASMQDMAAKMQANGGFPGMNAKATAAGGGAGTASESGSAAVTSASPGTGMGTPEQMEMAQNMMKNMDADTMKSMTEMAAKMQSSGAMGANGMPDMSNPEMMKNMQDMMSDPKMMENMTKMMKNIDPSTLAAQAKAAGMDISPEQAASMSEQMKNLQPEQMESLMKWARRAQRVMGWFGRVKRACFGTTLASAVSTAAIAVGFAWLFGIGYFGEVEPNDQSNFAEIFDTTKASVESSIVDMLDTPQEPDIDILE